MSLKTDKDTCFAFLIRHGATDSNLADPPILQGQGIDGALSATGQHQADQAARCLTTQGISAIYCSPLLRARETAERVAKPHGLPVQTIADITEANVGAWERRSWDEIRETETEQYENFQRDPAHHGYRDGENLNQVAARVIPAIENTMQSHLGEVIAIVGHNVVNRVFLAHAIQLPLALARGIAQENCGINVIRYRKDKTKAISVNSMFHLISDAD